MQVLDLVELLANGLNDFEHGLLIGEAAEHRLSREPAKVRSKIGCSMPALLTR